MYNGLVERCFVSCVDTFRRKTLEKSEEVVRPADRPQPVARTVDLRAVHTPPSRRQCVTKCCEKFLKHSARVSLRFAELNAGQQEVVGEQAKS